MVWAEHNKLTYKNMVTLHDKLYWNKEVRIAEYSDTFNVQLRGIIDRKPDCKIEHFGYNFYFRTNAGIKSKPYKNEGAMMRAIKQTIKKNGLTFVAFE